MSNLPDLAISWKNLRPSFFSAKAGDIWENSGGIPAGTTTAIIARSGAGKTSLFSFFAGLGKDFSGQLHVLGLEPQKTSLRQLRRSRLAIVPQQLDLIADISCMENVLLNNEIQPKPLYQHQIESMFNHLEAGHLIHKLPQQCSLGEQQRVAIIRSLCQQYELLLLDEPFSHLDDETAQAAWQLIQKNRPQASTIVISLLNHLPHLQCDQELFL